MAVRTRVVRWGACLLALAACGGDAFTNASPDAAETSDGAAPTTLDPSEDASPKDAASSTGEISSPGDTAPPSDSTSPLDSDPPSQSDSGPSSDAPSSLPDAPRGAADASDGSSPTPDSGSSEVDAHESGPPVQYCQTSLGACASPFFYSCVQGTLCCEQPCN